MIYCGKKSLNQMLIQGVAILVLTIIFLGAAGLTLLAQPDPKSEVDTLPLTTIGTMPGEQFDSRLTPHLQFTAAYTIYLPTVLNVFTATLPPDPTGLTCNPSNGSGGLSPGTYDITVAGRPAIVIVGDGYTPGQPTFLAFYLHGDGGNYDFDKSQFSAINQFIRQNGWIYVSPLAPQTATDSGGDSIHQWNGGSLPSTGADENLTFLSNVYEEMFANYNVCRNVLFGSSASGGSWYYDAYFFPKRGGTYPAFMDLNCGAAGVYDGGFWRFADIYQDLEALSQMPDIVNRSEFRYTIGTDDFLFDGAKTSSATYDALGFNVSTDFLPNVGHCGFSVSEKARDYWQSKAATLNLPDK